MAFEIREALKPWNRQRVEVRGILDSFGDWTHKGRPSLKACILDPEIEGKIISQHVWVVGCHHWKEFEDRFGQTIRFRALVESYVDQNRRPRLTNYCLANPDEPEFPYLTTALKVPELRGGLNGNKSRDVLDEFMVVEEVVAGPAPPPKPEPVKRVEAVPAPTVSPAPTLPSPVVTSQPAAADGTAMLKHTKRFIKVCGAIDRAREIAVFLKDNPGLDPAQLVLWINALSEE